ncbi:MAG: hypothetical protein JOZ38_00475, partial [Candidatus Eremiobacteraeota bacterium]|nr:hypothetical protein [Candidatus Eremiobacteraeota bacterium]
MRSLCVAIMTLAGLAACGGGASGGGNPPPVPTASPTPTPTPNPQASFYEPHATGDTWNYTCRDIKGGGENGGNPFSIVDSVLGATT